ncbi:MAG: VIT domain-containing protein [Myxococcota bacterium]
MGSDECVGPSMVEHALSLLLLTALPPGFLDGVAEFWRIEDPEAVDRGMLVVEAEDGSARGLAAHDVRVDVVLRGFVAETRVRQTFRNPTEVWLEASYVHPLPESGAVEALKLRIGDRRIEGQIKEKSEARRVYARARARGQAASLLEQIRANLFRTKVANVPPQGEVEVELVIRELLLFADGAFSYRYPIPVTPRFNPTSSPPSEQPTSWALGSVGAGPRIRVDFEPGLPPAWTTASHALAATDRGLEVVEPSSAQDFVLRWAPAVSDASVAMGFREVFQGQTYAAMMVVPPAPERQQARAREIVFVIDTSGSMGGPSILQAKRALQLALSRLRPEDCFDVVRFAADAEAMFGTCRSGRRPMVDQAQNWVSRLSAGGGTHMAPALRLAMGSGPKEAERLKQIVFITDGAVGNEPELLAQIRRELGSARLFTVGIGAAPNAAFMRDAARFGRGRFSFIGDLAEVEARMSELLVRLEKPALTSLSVDWGVSNPDQVPAQVPDVYAGDPMLLVARLSGDVDAVQVRSEDGWSKRILLAPGPGLHRLWARRRTEGLLDEISMGGARAALQAEVLRLGLTHEIVTPYTSFVAVEQRQLRPNGAPLRARTVPTPTTGQLPRGGSGFAWLLAAGLLCVVLGGRLWREA